jgi:hypothetical protein
VGHSSAIPAKRTYEQKRGVAPYISWLAENSKDAIDMKKIGLANLPSGGAPKLSLKWTDIAYFFSILPRISLVIMYVISEQRE